MNLDFLRSLLGQKQQMVSPIPAGYENSMGLANSNGPPPNTTKMAEPYQNPEQAIREDFGPRVTVRSPSPTPTPVPGSFEELAAPIFQKYDIPMPVGMGMYAAEGRGQGLGARRNNFYNIAAFDSNPDAAYSFDTPQEGIEAYAKFISGQSDRYASPKHKKKFQEAYAVRHDPVKYIEAIQNAGYAGDPKTYSRRSNNNYPSYAKFVMDTPEWRKNQ